MIGTTYVTNHEYNKILTNVRVLQDRIFELTKNNDKLHAIDSLRHENDAMKKTIVDLHAQILDTTQSADHMSDRITSLQHVNNDLKDRINFLQKENDGLKLKVGQVFDFNAIELEDLHSKCRDLGRRNENLFHNIRVYQKDWFRLADQLPKCNAEIKAQSDTIKSLEGKVLGYELGFQAQPEYRELLCLRSCAESMDSDMKSAHKELAEKCTTIKSLEASMVELSKENERLVNSKGKLHSSINKIIEIAMDT